MASGEPGRAVEGKHALVRRLDAAGWGMLLIWIGIALLFEVGWGPGFIGVGVILVAVQLGRVYFHSSAEGFALVMGTLFTVAGIWELLKTRLGQELVPGGLWPVLSIVAGVALVVAAFFRKRH